MILSRQVLVALSTFLVSTQLCSIWNLSLQNPRSHVCPILEALQPNVWSPAKPRNEDRDSFPSSSEMCVLRHLGGDPNNNDYGAWTICETARLLESRASDRKAIIYSFGLGTDTGFDEEVIERYGAVVHGFDPTPGSIKYVRTRGKRLPSCYFGFHPFGLNVHDGVIDLYPPENPNFISHTQIARPGVQPVAATLLSLSTIMQMLSHRKIHVLKMDIEGAEYAVLESLLNLPDSSLEEARRRAWSVHGDPSARQLPFDQLCVEFHPKNHPRGEEAGARAIRSIVGAMEERGYPLVHETIAMEFSFSRYPLPS